MMAVMLLDAGLYLRQTDMLTELPSSQYYASALCHWASHQYKESIGRIGDGTTFLLPDFAAGFV